MKEHGRSPVQRGDVLQVSGVWVCPLSMDELVDTLGISGLPMIGHSVRAHQSRPEKTDEARCSSGSSGASGCSDVSLPLASGVETLEEPARLLGLDVGILGESSRDPCKAQAVDQSEWRGSRPSKADDNDSSSTFEFCFETEQSSYES